MTTKPMGKRAIFALAIAIATMWSTGAATAQEDATSAAQRPVVHAPVVVPPVRPTTDTFPKWSEFPAPPTDIPTIAEIAQRVQTQAAASRQLKAETAALVWENIAIEPFALDARSRLNPAYTKPLDAQLSNQQIEALAAELHRRAVPPPVAD